MSKEINPGYGWRLLRDSETILVGDERWSNFGAWVPYVAVGLNHHTLGDIFRRRKIDPGEGWEIVPEKTPVQTDQQYYLGGEWFCVSDCNRENWNPPMSAHTRRRKSASEVWWGVNFPTPQSGTTPHAQQCPGCNQTVQKLDMAEQQEFQIRKEVSTARSLGDAVSLFTAVENIAGILGMLTEAEKCQRDFVKSGEKDAIAFALKWKEKK